MIYGKNNNGNTIKYQPVKLNQMKTNPVDLKGRTIDQEVEIDSAYLVSARKGRDSPLYSKIFRQHCCNSNN